MGTGLFLGSFNPVHRGHEKMVSSFLNSELIDDLWIILTPTPPHKHISELASFTDRWNMLELVFANRDTVHLSDVEQRIPSPHYTFRTLAYLKSCYPDKSFYLCIGGDTLQTLSSWYDYEKIAHKTELLVAERPGVPLTRPSELEPFTVHYCEHEAIAVSSTDIRKKLADGKMPGPDELHPAVVEYIRSEGLYGSAGFGS
ncbi:MAG: nicotinate (nicotinamide) nucleotide adenylyltransferase [Balneolaceae bacterium]|nr:MAG: nicotinate (nicotinamide) nucleotide adenylyltransferase [Balneolaceae bacterium]